MPGFALPGLPRVGWEDTVAGLGPALATLVFAMDRSERRPLGSFPAGVVRRGADSGPRSKTPPRVSSTRLEVDFHAPARASASSLAGLRRNSAFSLPEVWRWGTCLEKGLSLAQSAMKV